MGQHTTDDAIGETVLVALAQNRVSSAFDELLGLYQKRLMYYVRRLIRDTQEAEDVIQEVWIVVHHRLGSLKAPQAFRVWLFKIAHDIAINHLRRVSKFPDPMPEEFDHSDSTNTWDEFEAMVNAQIVHQTLEMLSHEHREVLTLRFLEQMELSEIAEVVGCSTGTIKSRLHYAKAALRHRIERQNNG